LQQKWKRNHSKYDPPIISTIHSLGLLILRKHLKQTSFKFKTVFKYTERSRYISKLKKVR
jgi:hypothetical protein